MGDDKMKYHICQYLNVEFKIMTLTVDEFACLGVFLLVGFVSSEFSIFLVMGFLLLWGIRRLKKGRGQNALLAMLYWYSDGLSRLLFRAFPRASKRYWI